MVQEGEKNMALKNKQRILVGIAFILLLAAATPLLPIGVTPLVAVKPYHFYLVNVPPRPMLNWGSSIPVPGQMCLVRVVDLTGSSQSIMFLTPQGWRRSATGSSFTIGH